MEILRARKSLIRSLYVKSLSIASTSSITFLMSATNENRVSHFWASQNTLFRSLRTVYVLLYSHWHRLSFQAPTCWNYYLQFWWYFTSFFYFISSSNKVFKDIKIFGKVHSRQFIRYQGKNLILFSIFLPLPRAT